MVEIVLGGLAEQEVGRGGRNCARRPRRAGRCRRRKGFVFLSVVSRQLPSRPSLAGASGASGASGATGRDKGNKVIDGPAFFTGIFFRERYTYLQ